MTLSLDNEVSVDVSFENEITCHKVKTSERERERAREIDVKKQDSIKDNQTWDESTIDDEDEGKFRLPERFGYRNYLVVH